MTVAKRTLLDGDAAPDWSGSPTLESTTRTTETAFDALNRPMAITLPDDSEERRVYDNSGRLKQVLVTPSWETTEQTVVDVITYDAKGQRTKLRYGNDVVTFYTYEPETFRLATLVTKKTESSSTKLQDLSYSYDPVGNIVAVNDACKPTITRGSIEVTGGCEYAYDALYRLTSATGREHDSTAMPTETAPGWQSFPANPNDPLTLHNFEETYAYDAVGNLEEVAHTNFGSFSGVAAGWTRTYETETVPNTETPKSNRLVSTTVDSTTSEYTHDAHGNLTSMAHLSAMAWSANDRLHSTTRVGNGHEMTCLYDAAGQRLRKRHDNGTDVATTVYLGALELYESTDSTEVTTLHVMDGTRRVLILEREGSTTRTRYQLGDHLGSACLEVDENGDVISMEEYHPYGSTALRYGSSAIGQKKYRYTGKECDDETGFTYHDARYYAPWLGRWTAADSAWFVDGTNLYAYCRGNPLRYVDLGGSRARFPVESVGPVHHSILNNPEHYHTRWGYLRQLGSVERVSGDDAVFRQRLGQLGVLSSGEAREFQILQNLSAYKSAVDFERGRAAERARLEREPTISAQRTPPDPRSPAEKMAQFIALGDQMQSGPGAALAGGIALMAHGDRDAAMAVATLWGIADAGLSGKGAGTLHLERPSASVPQARVPGASVPPSLAPDAGPRINLLKPPTTLQQARAMVPSDWRGPVPTQKGVGFRWFGDKGDSVRIDKGVPESPFPAQRVDHVIVNRRIRSMNVVGGASSAHERRYARLPGAVKWSFERPIPRRLSQLMTKFGEGTAETTRLGALRRTPALTPERVVRRLRRTRKGGDRRCCRRTRPPTAARGPGHAAAR